MRKSDHRNAIRSHEHFEALCAAAGPRGRRAALLQRGLQGGGRGPAAAALRAGGGRLGRLRTGPATGGPRTGTATRTGLPCRPRGRRAGRAGGRAVLTWLLKLDVVLFGGIRTGPFFGLLEADPRARPVRILYVASDQAVPGPDRRQRARAGGGPRAWRRGGTRSTRSCTSDRGPPDREEHGGRALAPRPLDAARSGSSAFAPQAAVEALVARRCGPQAVMERYYNFGGEGIGGRGARAGCRRCSR